MLVVVFAAIAALSMLISTMLKILLFKYIFNIFL